MNQPLSPPLKFTALRRFDVRTGLGVVVAVFFQPTNTAGDQEANANAKQQSRQRKPQSLRGV